MAKKLGLGAILIIISASAVVLAGTGVGIWLGVRSKPHTNPDWSFKISGNIEGGDFNITLKELIDMPSYEQEYTIKAKTDVVATFKGVQFSYLFENEIDISSGAANVTFIAWDGYSWTFNIDDLMNNDTNILAYAMNGEYLLSYPEGGNGYLYLIVPADSPDDFNGQRCVKNVVEIQFI